MNSGIIKVKIVLKSFSEAKDRGRFTSPKHKINKKVGAFSQYGTWGRELCLTARHPVSGLRDKETASLLRPNSQHPYLMTVPQIYDMIGTKVNHY